MKEIITYEEFSNLSCPDKLNRLEDCRKNIEGPYREYSYNKINKTRDSLMLLIEACEDYHPDVRERASELYELAKGNVEKTKEKPLSYKELMGVVGEMSGFGSGRRRTSHTSRRILSDQEYPNGSHDNGLRILEDRG